MLFTRFFHLVSDGKRQKAFAKVRFFPDFAV